MTAYDGEKNIFSMVSLPTGTFKVKLPREEGIRIRLFVCELKLVNEIKCDKLGTYFSGKNLSVPRDVLEAFDVVMKENPSGKMLHIDGSFHPVVPYQGDDLGSGITASRGIKHSLKLTSQGVALCMDYSVLPLIKQMPVMDFLKEHIRGFSLNRFTEFRRQVEKVLKGLNVTVTHRTTNQKFKIARLTPDNTQDIAFDIEDKNGDIPPTRVRLVDYFREKYSKDILLKHLPCLDLGKSKNKNYVPMEFCIIAGGQKFSKEGLDRYPAEKLRKISLASPKAREATIYDMLHSEIGPCGGDISVNFGINADMDMTTVTGRVIVPPVLKLGASRGRPVNAQLDKEKCDWNLKRNYVVSSIPVTVWGVLDFGNINLDTFIPDLIARCQRLNIRMDNPRCVERPPQNILDDPDRLHQMLENIMKRSRDELQILVCILPRKCRGYNYLKLVCDTRLGIQTQCCLSANASKTNRDQFLANIALKINAKIGGTNVELLNQPQCLQNKGRVMFVGADVNHPSALNATSPSIAAVSASMNWPAANKYSVRIDYQQHRTEKIMKFGSMCMELVNTYAQQNQGRPDTIVVFRDGVSGNQFDMVLNEELKDLEMTFATQNYFPNVTVIISQKRHTTRLFLDSDTDQNVPPGTVVDTKIVDPFGNKFYLCSHYGQIGTSKPAYYHVLQDQNKITLDQIQELIYSMCFTSAQCTKPVSLVPPVMYADRAAYRGRIYYTAMEPDQSSSSSSSSTSTMAPFDENLYKRHPNLENSMFFI